ncbi:hypothetical protein BDV97DRAFT_356879 [Delphinella strobiligena]|nr:hypothetical protein BDV97DRAFT_356879 [Delphinella strobiligena]
MNAIRKGKGKQKSSWPMETFETWRNVHGRPSSQKLSADVMATIETTSGKEGSIKSQDSRQAPSKRHADSLEAERTNKRRINNSQVQTRLQTYLRHEREKQEAADLAYATQLFEEERQRAEATQKSTPQPKECTVCSDVLPPLSFPAKPPTTTCTHTVNVCEACLQEWVSNQLSSNGWQGIHCPECPSTLSHPDMRLAASPATFVTYDTLSLRDTISTLQNFAWCLAPHCNFGQENTPHAQGAFMECTSCKYRQCLQHRCKWHDGETCDQYEYRVSGRKAKDEEVKNKKYLEKEAKQCPGMGCGAWIQKTSGCDHMTCRKCATEFCYLCRAPYASIRRMGNAAHAVDCRYHSDNLYPH